MKALSIHPAYAMGIFAKEKTIEVRTWKTDYRGDLLICSTNKKIKDTIPGHALCVVKISDIVLLRPEHLYDALMTQKDVDSYEGLYAWLLTDLRYIKPIPLKGKLGLWNYDGEIEYLKEPETDEEDEIIYKQYYEPIFI